MRRERQPATSPPPCRRARLVTFCAGLCLVLAAGCGTGDDDQTGVPQPIPLPLVRATRGEPSLATPISIVGLPGAAAGVGTVSVTTAIKTYQTEASAQGTFALVVEATADEAVELRYQGSPPALLKIPGPFCPDGNCQVPLVPGARNGVEPLTAPVDGKVLVRGNSRNGPATLLVVNFDNGDVRTGAGDTSGDFDIEITASSGDELRIYVDGTELESPWTLTVP